MFLFTICALEHLCKNRQPNICAQTVDKYFDVSLLSVCAQTVDEYFGRPFAVRLCTNG